MCAHTPLVEKENIPQTFDSGISADHFLDFHLLVCFVFLVFFVVTIISVMTSLNVHAHIYVLNKPFEKITSYMRLLHRTCHHVRLD